MTTLRPPAVAGLFYPDDPDELTALVDDQLVAAVGEPAPVAPEALVAPHAGYVYSGPVAAFAYRRLGEARPGVPRVVVLGPCHTMPLDTLAVSPASGWETALGEVPIDAELRAAVVTGGLAVADEHPHVAEHSIEVQVPFLQRVLEPGWSMLPVAVGRVEAGTVAALIDDCWTDDTLVVVSTDLSHYLNYDEARAVDARTAQAIVAGAGAAIDDDQACGAYPLRGLLQSEKLRSLDAELLDLRNSGDTAGGRKRVVGYAAVVFG